MLEAISGNPGHEGWYDDLPFLTWMHVKVFEIVRRDILLNVQRDTVLAVWKPKTDSVLFPHYFPNHFAVLLVRCWYDDVHPPFHTNKSIPRQMDDSGLMLTNSSGEV